ncbi:MAG: GTP-binding protein [Planctomycetes bacterium]|nr:GTP-binding protein [Planctomycetota bacterium]MBL7106887.1 GTP-binding protein [Phycisphaerae bacterium]
MNELNYTCPKCGNTSCEIDEFTTVTCKRCSYTEIYKADSSTIGNIFDFFTN